MYAVYDLNCSIFSPKRSILFYLFAYKRVVSDNMNKYLRHQRKIDQDSGIYK